MPHLSALLYIQIVNRTFDSAQIPNSNMQVAESGFQVIMPQQLLNVRNVQAFI